MPVSTKFSTGDTDYPTKLNQMDDDLNLGTGVLSTSVAAAAASATLAGQKLVLTNADVVLADAAVVSAQGQVTLATNQVTLAVAAKDAAEAALDAFDDTYLGAKASDPTLDNDGNALIVGAQYFNTTINKLKVYTTGSAWAALQDGISSVVADTSPELGGNLNFNNKLMIGGLNLARSTVASHPTTADIWTAGNQINWTGSANVTAFPNAPQGGVERTLICSAAAVFTAGSNMVIDGVNSGDSVTCVAGDQVIVKAISTTSYKLSRIKLDGTAQVAAGGGGMTQAQIQAYI